MKAAPGLRQYGLKQAGVYETESLLILRPRTSSLSFVFITRWQRSLQQKNCSCILLCRTHKNPEPCTKEDAMSGHRPHLEMDDTIACNKTSKQTSQKDTHTFRKTFSYLMATSLRLKCSEQQLLLCDCSFATPVFWIFFWPGIWPWITLSSELLEPPQFVPAASWAAFWWESLECRPVRAIQISDHPILNLCYWMAVSEGKKLYKLRKQNN